MRLSHLLYLWSALSLAALVRAEESSPRSLGNYVAVRWGREDGLPSNTVNAVLQGRDGILWVATSTGLARFDGLGFTSASGEMKITALAETQTGSIWLGTENGALFKRTSGVLQPMLPARDSDHRLTTMAVDRDGRVWAGFASGPPLRWGTGEAVPIPEAAEVRDLQLASDFAGKVWFTTDSSYGYFDGDQAVALESAAAFPRLLPRKAGGFWLVRGNVLTIRGERNELVYGVQLPWSGGATEVQTLMEDHTGALWIGTKGQGLFRFDGEFSRAPAPSGVVLALAEDREGDIWVGALGAGLARLRPRQVWLHTSEIAAPDEPKIINAVCADPNSGVWICGSAPGVIRYDQGKTQAYSRETSWPGGIPSTACQDRAGGVFFATAGDGVVHWDGKAFVKAGGPKTPTALFVDRESVLYAGAAQGLFERRGDAWRQLLTTEERITSLGEDSAGGVWAGTESGRLYRASARGFEEHVPECGSAGAIRTIVSAPIGGAWVGARKGVIWLGQKDALISRANGLPDDDVRQILVDKDQVWLGTGSGLISVSGADLNGKHRRIDFASVGREEGLKGLDFSEAGGNGSCRSTDGKLWFATSQGLLEVDPSQLEKTSTPLPVFFELHSSRDSGLLVTRGRGGVSTVEAHYAAICLSRPEAVRYRYRLLPENTGWIENGAARSAIVADVAPGRHEFEVSAFVEGGWMLPGFARARFEIEPAFWQRPWPRVLAGILVVALVILLARFWTLQRLRGRMRALERESAIERERARIARDMHDELGASLTNISILSEQLRVRCDGLPPETRIPLDKIGRAAREVSQTLDEIVWTVNPRNDSLEGLVGYIVDYAMECIGAAGLSVAVDSPEELPAAQISSETRHNVLLAVKEALNNVVKHAGATNVRLVLELTNSSLSIVVSDDGQGFAEPEGARRSGLDNMRSRMKAEHGECQISSACGKGTTVSLHLPLSFSHANGAAPTPRPPG